MCRRGIGAGRVRTTLLVLAVSVVTAMGQVPAHAAAPYVAIGGSGSTWAQNELDQWRSSLASSEDMTVDYSGIGSTPARRDFTQGTTDFAVSELPFQANPDDGSAAEVPTAGYAYLPITAGGLSFMYNLKIGGVRVTGLRLSGETITKVFTGAITQWNDPAIQADNPGLVMPDTLLTPVIHSDCSGTSAQLTAWMSSQFSSLWATGTTACYPTSVVGAKYQPGSDGVSGYVAQSYGEGAITYVESSYAKKTGFPVAKVLNRAGYYVAPTASAVAIALTHARLNADLTQNLTDVYASTDPRAYPLSGYAYLIVPTEVAGTFTADKGNTLAAFARYAVCAGQLVADQLGYSPLPLNLVAAASDQIQRIPGGGGGIDLANCSSPTFSPGDSASDTLLTRTAPAPTDCDRHGAWCPGTIPVAAIVTASSDHPTAGTAVTLTARLTPSGATGNVVFADQGVSLGASASSGGTALFVTSVLAVGSHTITASYVGDALHSSAVSAPVTVTVSPDPTGPSGSGDVVGTDGAFTLIAPDNSSPAILDNARLDSAGRSISTGTLGSFTVVDERAASMKGWQLTVTVGDFVNGDTVLSGKALGIAPRFDPAHPNAGPGVPTLGSEKVAGQPATGWTFARLDAGQYDSAAVFDADLTLVVPAGTPAGTYISSVTITLVST